MGAMMAGEQLGVGHEPRHGTAYVGSWIKALQDDPKEIRLASVDAQKAADWMVEPGANDRAGAPDRAGPGSAENSDPMRHANTIRAARPFTTGPGASGDGGTGNGAGSGTRDGDAFTVPLTPAGDRADGQGRLLTARSRRQDRSPAKRERSDAEHLDDGEHRHTVCPSDARDQT